MKAKSGFEYVRILGHAPKTNASVETYGWLGDFVTVFGPPEIAAGEKSILIFWNFTDRDGGGRKYFSAYATIPASQPLTSDTEINVALTGGYTEGRDSFASSFMDHDAAVLKGDWPPSTLTRNSAIYVISNPTIALAAVA